MVCKNAISHPKLLTSLPGSKSAELLKRRSKSFLKVEEPVPVGIVTKRAFGQWIDDMDGNTFLNFNSSINAIGECHPRVIQAIHDQVNDFMHGTGLPFVECAEKLKEMLPGELKEGKIGYTSTGSEAVDLMLRLARYYTKKRIIVSFHGMHFGEGTSDSSRLAGDSGHIYKGGITPLISETIFAPWPYCYRCPLGHSSENCGLHCLAYFEEIFESVSSENIAGIIAEGLPANSGVIVPPPGYMEGLRALSKEKGIMLLIDEVFSGFGKTGKMLAVENWSVNPDIVILGKSMGGGLPISAVATSGDVIENCGSLARGRVGSFSGNVVSCAASIATMEVIKEERLFENAQKVGAYLKVKLEELAQRYDIIGDVRGINLMVGIELVKDLRKKIPATDEAKKIQESAYRKGLLIGRFGRYGNILRMTPYLATTEQQVNVAFEILNDSFKSSLVMRP
jgi:4-aminobutyrate aminotransferase-like enzyme